MEASSGGHGGRLLASHRAGDLKAWLQPGHRSKLKPEARTPREVSDPLPRSSLGICLVPSLAPGFPASMARGQTVWPPKAPGNIGPQPSHPEELALSFPASGLAFPGREPSARPGHMLSWLGRGPMAGPPAGMAAPTFSLSPPSSSSLTCSLGACSSGRLHGEGEEEVWVVLSLHRRGLQSLSSYQKLREKMGLPQDQRVGGWNTSDQELWLLPPKSWPAKGT